MKNWKLEKTKFALRFWRHKINSGFCEVCRVEKYAPAWYRGKYQIAINTPSVLKTQYRNTLKESVNVARYLMITNNA